MREDVVVTCGIFYVLQILELQLAVENLEAYYPAENRNITLKDICFKPLEPYNQNCAIMSPLNYFQNNLTRLNQIVKGDFGIEADFHDHFISCTKYVLYIFQH